MWNQCFWAICDVVQGYLQTSVKHCSVFVARENNVSNWSPRTVPSVDPFLFCQGSRHRKKFPSDESGPKLCTVTQCLTNKSSARTIHSGPARNKSPHLTSPPNSTTCSCNVRSLQKRSRPEPWNGRSRTISPATEVVWSVSHRQAHFRASSPGTRYPLNECTSGPQQLGRRCTVPLAL